MKQAKFIEKLQKTTAVNINYQAADSYYWSPKNNTVFYQENDQSEVGRWTLLHETCHGLLQHTSYVTDFDLIRLELDAWEEAKVLAKSFNINIDEDHVQDCLDSYRDWQYKRSICPHCNLGGIQTDAKTYTCIFCERSWTVSKERFFRPYRKKVASVNEA